MGRTDPEVALRVAEWLALHINNHDFIWGWQRWENVLELPVYDPVRYCYLHLPNACPLKCWSFEELGYGLLLYDPVRHHDQIQSCNESYITSCAMSGCAASDTAVKRRGMLLTPAH